MVPLFGAIPGSVEIVLFGVLNLVIALVVGFWVYRDASRRGNGAAALWAVAVGVASLLLSIVGFLLVFVLYLVVGRD